MNAKAQFIEANGKPQYAVIPYRDYLRLVEAAKDAEDARPIDEFERKLALTTEKLTLQAEYATLRGELEQAKKYVLERPLLIVGVGITLMTTKTDPAAVVVLQALMTGLLLFNFWFTVNRLISGARIVAYILLVLEPGAPLPWAGWESSLRKYRIWSTTTPDAQEIIDERMKDRDVPDSLMYYGPIFWLHVALVVSSAIIAVQIHVRRPEALQHYCRIRDHDRSRGIRYLRDKMAAQPNADHDRKECSHLGISARRYVRALEPWAGPDALSPWRRRAVMHAGGAPVSPNDRSQCPQGALCARGQVASSTCTTENDLLRVRIAHPTKREST